MDPEEQFSFLDDIEISDKQAFDSDVGGDSDAEDGKYFEELQPIASTSGVSSRNTNESRYSQRLKRKCSYVTSFDNGSDYDSDDSVEDPSFAWDDTPTKRNAILDPDDAFSENEDSSAVASEALKKAKRNLTGSNNKSEKNADDYVFSWKVSDSKEPEIFKSFQFCKDFGINVKDLDYSSPFEIFNNFFDDDLENLIVEESNKYARQKGTSLDLTKEELRSFLGCLIVMGFHKLPSMRMPWSSDSNFHVDRISKVMSLKRFLKIVRFLHVNDNTKTPKKGEENFDKLFKIRPIINTLNEKFQNAFSPGRNLAIDESMVGFKGRTSLKQYMPLKPTKRGIKIWCITCSKTGYLLKFSVYEGKSSSEEIGSLSERVVLELSKPYAGHGYCLYFDNFFSTIPLLYELGARKLFGCGTFRMNRKHSPKEIYLDSTKMKLGEFRHAMTGDISLILWKDRGQKPVSIVSSMHNPDDKTTVKRTNREGVKEEIPCPKSVFDYNDNMGGVDHFDQLLQCYSISQKSRRWWLKLFYHFVDCVIVNSFILYNLERTNNGQKTVPQIQFRSTLANQLISDFCSRKDRGRKTSVARSNKQKKMSGREVTVENSFVFAEVGDHLPKKGTRRRCAYCSTRKDQKRTSIYCNKCNIGLCVSCFEPFHKK